MARDQGHSRLAGNSLDVREINEMKSFGRWWFSVMMKRLIRRPERYGRRARVVWPTLNRVTGNEWSYCNSVVCTRALHACVRVGARLRILFCIIGSLFFYFRNRTTVNRCTLIVIKYGSLLSLPVLQLMQNARGNRYIRKTKCHIYPSVRKTREIILYLFISNLFERKIFFS